MITKELVNEAFNLLERHTRNLRLDRWAIEVDGRWYDIEKDSILATSPPLPNLDTLEVQTQCWDTIRQGLGV